MKYFLLKANEKYIEYNIFNGEVLERKTVDYYTIEVDNNASYTSYDYSITLKCQFYLFPDNWPFQIGRNICVNNDIKSLGFVIRIPFFMKYRKTSPNDFRTANIEVLGIFDTKEEVELVKNLQE